MVLVRGGSVRTNTAGCEDTTSRSYLYLFGGWNGTTELADLWRFNTQEQRWELLSQNTSGDMALAPDGARIFGPDPRSCHQMAVDQKTGDIYMLGRFVDAHAAMRPPANTAQSEDAAMDAGLDRGDSSFTPGSHGGLELPHVHSRETSDFWQLHTRGPMRGTWQMLSDSVEVSLDPLGRIC